MRSIEDTIPPRNRTLAPAILAWVAEYLRQPDGPDAGQPLQLTREQARIMARWFAIDGRGRFVYRRGVLRRAKGWGKSPYDAVLAAVELCGPCRFDGFDADGMPVAVEHAAPWILLAAVAIDQTKNVMRALHGMFSDAAIDEYRLELGKLIVHSERGQIEAVTSNPRTVEGARATFTVLDESQEWVEANRGLEMAQAIRRNAAKLGTARTLETCNAHRPGEGSVAEETFESWRKAGGNVPGLLYDSLEGPDVDLGDRDALVAALDVARGDSHWLDLERLADEVGDPTTPAHVAHRYYLNRVVAVGEERWMGVELWDAAARPDHKVGPRSRVVLGFDGSRVDDHTAIVLIEVLPAGGYHLELACVWVPGESDDEVPMLEVLDELRELCRRFRVREIVADPFGWQFALAQLRHDLRARTEVVAFPQSPARMVPAAAQFVDAIATGSLTHSGDVALREYVLNAVAHETRHGPILRKRRQGAKIDAAVAAVMAFSRAQQLTKRVVPRVLWLDEMEV